MPRPSARLLAFSVPSILLAAVAIRYPIFVALFLLYQVFGLVILLVDHLTSQPHSAFQISRTFPERMIIGREYTYVLTAALKKGSTQIWIRDHWPQSFVGSPMAGPFKLTAETPVSITLSCRPERRGRFHLSALFWRYTSPLGLWNYEGRIECPQPTRVIPRFAVTREALQQLVEAGFDGHRTSNWQGDGTEFDALRPYRPGDPVGRIDWKATARRDALISKDLTVERSHDLIMAVDAGRLMGARYDGLSKLDHSVDACLALSHAGIRFGDKVGVMTFDNEVRAIVPPGKKSGQMGRILDAVCEVHSRFKETRFDHMLVALSQRQTKRALVVVFTDFIDRPSAEPMLTALSVLSRRHACLFVALEDPVIEEALNNEVIDRIGIAEKTVAYDMKKSRLEVLEWLKSRGVSVLNCPPNRLSAALLNRYLELRIRAVV